VKRYKDFIYVKSSDKKTAEEIGAKSPPEVIFFDPDGEEIYRQPVTNAGDIERAMGEATKKYGPKEVSWAAYDEGAVKAAREAGKVVVLAFASDSKDSEATLKAFEDRTLAKLHEKIAFFKIEYRKDDETAKLWGVSAAPTVITVDGAKEMGAKAVIEKSSGKKTPSALKGMIQKALKAIEKK
jgi:hypothetical protein